MESHSASGDGQSSVCACLSHSLHHHSSCELLDTCVCGGGLPRSWSPEDFHAPELLDFSSTCWTRRLSRSWTAGRFHLLDYWTFTLFEDFHAPTPEDFHASGLLRTSTLLDSWTSTLPLSCWAFSPPGLWTDYALDSALLRTPILPCSRAHGLRRS
jgi:hypothetical protein